MRNTANTTGRSIFRRWRAWRRIRRFTRPKTAHLNLALQGGGAHGAFTWGVLDRLLEEEWLVLDGLSGTSAGAMNAVVLASGWLNGGRVGAKTALHGYWRAVSNTARMGPLQAGPLEYLIHGWNRDWSPAYIMLSALTKMASPYQLNPTGFNPLRRLLESHVDFERLRNNKRIKLFIAATNVQSGMLKLFRTHELSVDAVLASACLPLLFHAIRIEEAHYWDGGYTANPPLLPLMRECRSRDLLLVQLEPLWRGRVPTRLQEIVDRSNEIAFNANLLNELQVLAALEGPPGCFPIRRSRLGLLPVRYRLHHLETEGVIEGMGRTSRINADWSFLLHLRDLGRQQADAWLEAHKGDIGRRSTMTLNRYL
ncbi:patatin-like phospholipase family protein [Alkalilimnicola ehrlichii]|uniref:patatin-like phospholipase family protein n=1 Tax=Alkalilimnicola ehrlichii TaxID=351052 RepID=UPI002162FBE9|nr:patatin-like phospholipase family protein [Alkalilimnicola ehrlichii]